MPVYIYIVATHKNFASESVLKMLCCIVTILWEIAIKIEIERPLEETGLCWENHSVLVRL